jgi:16S rRNA (guanine(966)-N(2))-methyltransferase RsmD
VISKLQIISGKYRGKKLAIPASARPTQQRTRAAIFNILNSLDNKKMETFSVWDAFAGSGAMGVEFISRFMPQLAVFTDTDQNAISSIRENTKSIADCSVIIKKMNAIDFDLAEIKNPVIVFIDPPYSESNSGCQLVKKIGLSANVGTLVVWEMENDFNLDEKILNGFSILKDRTYGRARFVIIERN